MKLIVGLGNPGRSFRLTRHNIGFCLIEKLARKWEIPINQKGRRCLYGAGRLGEEEVILAKPLTYMNLSGEAVSWLVNFFNLNLDDLVILQDDLDLPLGAIRIRLRGGHGGHQGVKSIIEALGGNNFLRVKIGVGRPLDPQQDPAEFLLAPLKEEEREEFKALIAQGMEAVEILLLAGPEQAMAKFHRK